MGLPFTTSVDMLTGVQPGENSAGVTADTTGPSIDVSKRQLKSVQVICVSRTQGTGAFTFSVSNDGTNWVAYNRLVSNVTNTNVQTDTRVATVTLGTASSQIFFFPVGDYFRYIRCELDVTTDGVYKAILQSAG